jgi:creatinine amidohydrolase
MKRALVVGAVLCAINASLSNGRQSTARIYKLEELRWPQVDALDRERTMFILPTGMLEEHGPHLPIGSDTFGVAFEAAAVGRRVARALPEWNIVTMPLVPYGHAGANLLGGQLVHPGTYAVRQSTIRSLVADVSAQVAQNRFKWIFVLTGHAAPPHNLAINEASDFVSETFGVTMLHVSALFRADDTIQAKGRAVMAKHFSAAQITAMGMDPHAGVSETSINLALRPRLVPGSYRSLPPLVGRTREQLQAIAGRPGWQGYFSSPAQASAAYGHAIEAWWVEGLSDLILRATRGEDLLHAPRAPQGADPALASVLGKALEDERAFEAKLQEWLARHREPKR